MKIRYLKYYNFLFLLIWMHPQNSVFAQEINPDSLLIKVKQKLELIKDYKADIDIHLDVDFIRMPDKHAKMYFKHPDKVRFTSDEFIMLPKSGIGISLRNLLAVDFLAVYSSQEEINGKAHVVVKVMPERNKSDI